MAKNVQILFFWFSCVFSTKCLHFRFRQLEERLKTWWFKIKRSEKLSRESAEIAGNAAGSSRLFIVKRVVE
jgi:hypothetical protein